MAGPRVIAGEFRNSVIPDYGAAAQRLSGITGLPVRYDTSHSINSMVLQVPEGVDYKDFVNKFAEQRNLAGINRQQLKMDVRMEAAGTFAIPAAHVIVPGVLDKLEERQAGFRGLLPAEPVPAASPPAYAPPRS